MNQTINDGGPAFPTSSTATNITKREDGASVLTNYGHDAGMTLRDYFAASEVIGHADDICSQASIALAGPKPEGNWSSNPVEWLKWEAKWRAELRFIRADAMLKARETKP